MKLQPSFSWQKYEGEEESQKNQFQFQLQRQHNLVSNAINTTIDDLSYWTKERPTGFTWVDGRPIYTKSIPTGPLPVSTTIIVPTGITGPFTVIEMNCCVSNGSLSSSNTLTLPHIAIGVPANSISMVRNGTDITITSGGTDRSAYSGYITLKYVKR